MAVNRFCIQRTLGEGGFGQVFLAKDTLRGELVAIKVLKTWWDTNTLARFRREAQEIARLSSKRIVRILLQGLDHSPPFYVMPFYPNGSLRDRLIALQQRGQVIEPAHALRLVLGLLDGLEIAHQNGIHHRDLKPENILLDAMGEFVLTDFGVGEFVHRQSMILTLGGGFGTPEYCAPEQWQSGDGSPAADIYSLGVVLFELMIGHRPRWLHGTAAPPSAYDQRISSEVDTLFNRMIAPIGRRITSCDELRSEIERILEVRFGVKKPSSISWDKIAAGGLIGLILWGLFGGNED